MQGVQKVIYDIIWNAREIGLSYMTVPAIKVEAMTTPLAELEKEFVGTAKNLKRKDEAKLTKLDFAISQALNILKEKGLIRQTMYGHWKVVRNAKKYKPVVCKAIEHQYEIHCPKCGTYKYEITEKSKIDKKCPECGKKVHIEFFRWHCPVRKMFIGNPVEQCELLHPTGLDEKGERLKAYPMNICYFDTKPTKTTFDSAIRKIQLEDEKLVKERRYYSKDARDPLSKYFLPNLVKED